LNKNKVNTIKQTVPVTRIIMLALAWTTLLTVN